MRQQLSSQNCKQGLAFKPLWLFPGFLSCFLLAAPAEAAKLESWRFDGAQNRLEFQTDEGIRPRAQLVSDPTRLVIDLPGTVLGRPKITQSVGQVIRAVRVAQFERDTTRIVVELAPGYTLDPQQVSVRGTSPTQWSVQLPTPQRLGRVSTPTQPLPRPLPNAGGGSEKTAPLVVAKAETQLQDVRVTPDGFFIDTRGTPPKAKVSRSRDQKQIEIELSGTTIAKGLEGKGFAVNRYGVKELEVSQAKTSPPVARITLKVDKKSPDWLVSVSKYGGVVVLPKGGAGAIADSNRANRSKSLFSGEQSQLARSDRLATIESIALGGNQLLIRANQPLSYSTDWQGKDYRLILRSAQLSADLKAPKLGPGSPVARLRLRQVDAQTVEVLVSPGSGAQIAKVSKPTSTSLLLSLQRANTTISVSQPIGQDLNPIVPTQPVSQANLPRPIGRRVVVIDPGHGGPDPGAVGRGGLRETQVVLPIGIEVARILQQQGVQAVLTRQDERDLDLAPRVAIAERANADVFVSIHANAINLSRPDINGLETYYAPGSTQGATLARTIHNSILQSLNVRDRGVRSARFYVIRRTSMPATLVETGFVTGAEDAPKLASPAFRSQMATAIAKGILQYLQSGR